MQRTLLFLLLLVFSFTCLAQEDTVIPEATYQAENAYMQMAIDEAREGIYLNHGGPFGSVIVKDDQVIASGHNRVLLNNDPTCHGEIDAIRSACTALDTFDLTGCTLYTTGEPCPMCLFACLWANIDTIYFGCTIEDNDMIGFRDEQFDQLMGGRTQLDDYLRALDRDACLKLFEEYTGLHREVY